jgi:hypothetical protein
VTYMTNANQNGNNISPRRCARPGSHVYMMRAGEEREGHQNKDAPDLLEEKRFSSRPEPALEWSYRGRHRGSA